MAKIVYACVRNVARAPVIKERVESILGKLVPDNIPGAKCKVVDHGEIIYGISTYTPGIAEKESSVCMGMVYDNPGKWWAPMADHPEGSYAIFRASEEYVEAITDITGSRAIWYYKDDEIFVTGTSQRAIANVVGKFEFENRNIPWLLSAGTLAPSLSWCKNIHFVDPDGSVLLNRKTWALTVKANKPEFPIANKSDKEFQRELKNLLIESFSKIDVDLSKWILPISGGYDSRGIACLLKEAGKDITRLSAITWGLKASQNNKRSDGYLGGVTAKSLGMQHKFWATDDTKESTEKVFERFVTSTEGRIDHISGYSDGMAIWKDIFESDKDGILRGDDTFGLFPTNSFARSKFLTGYRLCSDFSNLENYREYGFEEQVIPEYFNVIPGLDSPGLYRDRLYQQFRIPFILSALSDVKYAYTELLNPFLTRKIVLCCRTWPDRLRSDRLLWTTIINEISPKVPYATEQAIGAKEDILKTPAAVELFTNELSSDYIKQLFPKEFLNNAIDKLQRPFVPMNSGVIGKIKNVMKRTLPVSIKESLRVTMPKPTVDAGLLAFRIYTAGKMYKMLTEDVNSVNKLSQMDTSPSGSNEQLEQKYAIV